MSVLVKICGITSLDDAMDAADCGVDWLGFNFYPDSPRYIEPAKAFEIIQDIPSAIEKIGVFVNEAADKVADIAIDLSLDRLQFHGDETAEYCNAFGRPWYKAFRLQTEGDLAPIPSYECDWILADAFVEKAFGGTGVVSNWDLARCAGERKKLILSGGLKPENIEMALEAVKPQAVDVASGVESSPGVKDKFKVEEFIKRVKRFKK
ncbi:MAG: phosphoribosylanthranilate isomerase [Deltaproteobacteria bacterium]|nr:phosphoribosylanthranilate isomerase [Deltaproteobacteria bacterium]